MSWKSTDGPGRGSKESPLERKPPPRRVPGQSLAEDRLSDLFDKAVPWITLPAFLWAVFVMEVIRWFWSVPPGPKSIAVVAVVGTAMAVYRLRPIYSEIRAVRKGIWGERYVGQVLEDLCRPRGYRVLHDLPSSTGDFNVDHVLIGPAGVFAIETKNYARPTKGDQKIVYDGQSLKIPGLTPETDLLGQAKGQAAYVRDVLRRTTGHDVPVRPVLVFAGWYVERKCKRPDVWVVNETYLPAWLDYEDERLTPEDVALYADRLANEAPGR
jgi:hypothetical protein